MRFVKQLSLAPSIFQEKHLVMNQNWDSATFAADVFDLKITPRVICGRI